MAGCAKQSEISSPGNATEGSAVAEASAAASVEGPSNPSAVDSHSSPEASNSVPIVRFVSVPQIPRDLVIMETVFWEPDDTNSLRERIPSDAGIAGANVLEIGTGSGLISLCCLQAGASQVVATDINPNAIANARYNAAELGFADRLETRLVPRRSPGAWTVIQPEERFDFIISNPPWEDQKPTSIDQFALYDPDFELLDSLVEGARSHLKPGGRMWLAYGCVTAIRRIEDKARTHALTFEILDDRSLDELPEVFLPGMLMELRVPEGVSAEQKPSGE